MSAQGTLGRMLPDRPVVRLTDALTCALYGAVAEGGPNAKVFLPGGLDAGQWSEVPVQVIKTAEGGLLYCLDAEKAAAKEAEFFTALANAAAEGTVTFQGERHGGPFDTALAGESIGSEPIPQAFFASPIEFSIETGRIDLDFERLSEDEQAAIERLATTGYKGDEGDFRGWRAVGVERVGFLRWLASYRGKAAVEMESAVPDHRPKPTDQAVRQWMQDRVEQWPDNESAPSEEADLLAAKVHFAPGLSREEFRSVRKAETPAAWHASQGRRLLWGKAKLK